MKRTICLLLTLALLPTGCSGGSDGEPEDSAVPLTAEELAEFEGMFTCVVDVTDGETGEYLK